MLEERLKELFEKYGLEDEKAVTFGHPKMKMNWVLPMPGITFYSIDQFQPFFIYFDTNGISFFPLDLNNKYAIIGKSMIAWADMKSFAFKKGMLMEDEIKIEFAQGKINMKIPKAKAMNNWVKEHNQYLIEHNHFYNKK